jgi:hypothetical protein
MQPRQPRGNQQTSDEPEQLAELATMNIPPYYTFIWLYHLLVQLIVLSQPNQTFFDVRHVAQ